MVAIANVEAWSPAQASNEDQPAAEPIEIANLREACAHLAHVQGADGIHLHHPSDEVLTWFRARGRLRLEFASKGVEYTSFNALLAGHEVIVIVPRERLA